MSEVYAPPTLDGLQNAVINDRIDRLTEGELLSLVLSDTIGIEIVAHFGGFKGMCFQPLEKFLRFRGMRDAKIIRIAACFEIARRIVHQIVQDRERHEQRKEVTQCNQNHSEPSPTLSSPRRRS